MQDYHFPTSDPEQPRGQSDAISPPEEVARYIRNFRLTSEGTLRSVQPPAELAPRYRLDNTGFVENGNGLTLVAPTRSSTSRYNGVFHARQGEFNARDVTLWHFRGTIWSYQGWNSSNNFQWEPIYGNLVPTTSSYGYDFPEDASLSQFLTQFVKLPSGILMIPQGARAAVYDGYGVEYLGYDIGPGAPEPRSPRPLSYSDTGGEWTDTDGRVYDPNGGGWNFNGRALPWSFGTCRIGTIDVMGATANFNDDVGTSPSGKQHTNPNGGTLKEGMVRARLQWINSHGDLSPSSPPSTAWTCQKEDNVSKDRKKDEDELASALRIQLWWGGLQAGPEGTIGRIFSKTRDLVNSGDPTFYEVPANSSSGLHEFATIPDNVCDFYADNMPESWLQIPYTAVDPMPTFKLACLFSNRLWIANTVAEPGLLRASMQGRWGTLPAGKDIYYPDATGSEITGLHAVGKGMLVFTSRSTFIVEPNDAGDAFTFSSLSTSVGCVAPNSIATLANGTTVWLSREGFHAYDGKEGVQEISRGRVGVTVRRINPSRRHRAVAVVDPDIGEYRCWVPLGRSDFNDYCFVFDGKDWRERDDMTVDCACVTDDQRQYVLVAGSHPIDGSVNTFDSLFVLDRAGAWTREFTYATPAVTGTAKPQVATWTFLSAWLRASRAHRTGSPVRIRLWLRESQSARIRLKVYRDWRLEPAVMDVVPTDSKAPDRYATDDPPSFYGDTLLGANVSTRFTRTKRGTNTVYPASFRRRRPFWAKMDITVPACEVFAFELEGTADCEIVGFQYLENAASHHGGNTTPGGKR